MMIIVMIISSEDYIPVFISLKDVNDESGNYIERKLQSISIRSRSKEKKYSSYMRWLG